MAEVTVRTQAVGRCRRCHVVITEHTIHHVKERFRYHDYERLDVYGRLDTVSCVAQASEVTMTYMISSSIRTAEEVQEWKLQRTG
jgi:hypothetical protein